ncbi:NIPSNAP family protein [Sphingobium sp. AN558]|uniref:NIPSNAP family protein n=1 Tax=Sphingobium sp. AN558 TaxID=3133442 RepID=UPI0030C40111
MGIPITRSGKDIQHGVKTKVDLKFSQNAGFNEVLSEVAPFLGDHRWTLVYGLQALVGDLGDIMHLWEVEVFADIGAGLNAAFSDPELAESLARLPEFMNNETQQILVETPYSP